MKKQTGKIVPFALALIAMGLNLSFLQPVQAQTWITKIPLNVARWAHTATLLTNDTVLIAGGLIYNTNGISADTNACELYNPATGISSLTASMQYSRHSHRATRLNNGQVLISGGGNASSEVYDPSSGTWINFASMNDERIVHTATLLPSGQVLVAAGYNDNSGQELSSAELYDPASGTWTNTASMPYAADTLAAVLLTNGMVLVCGGSTNGAAVTNAVLFDPVSQTWTNTAPMNKARAGHTATLLPNGKVLVEGGTGDNSAEVYDPIAATWTYVASMNDGRLYPEACLLSNGRVMVLGDGNPDVELYDSASNTWTYTGSLPVPGNQQTATVLAGGQVVVTGGSGSEYNGPALAVVELYGPLITVTASPRSGPEPLTVQFSSPSVDSASNTVTHWNWNFGDGATSTAQSPAHTYGNLGSFSPKLVVQNAAGVFPVVTGPGAITVTLSQSAFLTNLPGSPAAFTFHNFANTKSLQFNGSAAKATNSDGVVLELTKSGSTRTGSAFSGNPLSFTHNVGFSTFFVFRLGNPSLGTPGDGITFTIQSDSLFALGNGGAGDFGIQKSLNVEFDAFKNGTQSTTSGGVNANQIAINTNGAAGFLVSVPVTTPLNNGNLWYAWVDYEGVSQDLEVRLAQIPVRPLAPTLDTTVNLPAILGITNVLTGNLLVNGGFESEPNWGGGVYYDGSATALVGSELPGWTIEPNHAVTIHKSGGAYLTISGGYSVNTDGEGYMGNNANFYQDFASMANSRYMLSFNWQSWGQYGTPTTSKQEVSVVDTLTGAVLFNGLYTYDGNGPHPVHAVTANFQGTGNPLRLRIQESPQSGYNDNTFMVDDFSVTSSSKYANAYAGFTGAGGNQQDILAWKFMPLPTTRFTGTFNATNLPHGFNINKGIVLARHRYVVAGITYTNFSHMPFNTVSNANAQFAFATGIAELAPVKNYTLPNPNAVDIALSNNAAALDAADFMDFAMLAAYTNSDSGGEGAAINYNNPDYIPFAPYYANIGFDNLFNMTEMSYNTIQDQLAASPPAAFNPPSLLTQLQIDSATFTGPNDGQWISLDVGGVIQGNTITYSLGTAVGTMTARQQVVESPPEPLIISSPRSDGTNFVFDFGTVSNQSYTVWANVNLATTNWGSYTNLIGDGYFQEITIPLTNGPQSFFQLTSP